MYACDTACLKQSASKSHSAQPVGLPQTKHSSSGTSGLLSFFSCAGASHFTCLIALLPFDHNARSPCGISFPHSAHLPLNFTASWIQSLIFSSPSRSLLLLTRRPTRRGSCPPQVRPGPPFRRSLALWNRGAQTSRQSSLKCGTPAQARLGSSLSTASGQRSAP